MTLSPTRITCSSLILLAGGLSGVLFGCGTDEPIFVNIPTEDDPDSGNEDSGGSVSPVTPVSPSGTVNPVSPAGVGPATSLLGAACSQDSQCGTDMVCVTADEDTILGGGAGNGYCAVDCTAATGDEFCETYQAGSVCISTSQSPPVAYCMAPCSVGDDPSKCRGREDVLCDFLSTDTPFCRPACLSDADCGGRQCHVGRGVCVDELDGTDPIGTACDPAANAENNCESGLCIAGSTPGTLDSGFCTGICRVGTFGCGTDTPMPDDPSDPFCANVFVDAGVGDVGLCYQRCNCDDDCKSDQYVCLAVPEAGQASLGTVGYCIEYDTPFDPTSPDNAGFALGVECPAIPDSGAVVDSGADSGGSDANTEAGMSEAGTEPSASDAAMMSLPPDSATINQPDSTVTAATPDAAADASNN